MDMDLATIIPRLGMFFVPFLLSLSFHEWAHGFVANLKGDPTAKMMGRLTMNPFAHADPIGTFLLPGMAVLTGLPLFGWAKPVPVNERNLRNPKNDIFWVALAGPVSNLLLATLGVAIISILFHQFPTAEYTGAGVGFATYFVVINLMLAVFNLIPIHPLDGGKIVARFLPYNINRSLENAQPILTMLLLLLFLTSFLQRFLTIPIKLLLSGLCYIFGLPSELWNSIL